LTIEVALYCRIPSLSWVGPVTTKARSALRSGLWWCWVGQLQYE
jgi:DNA-binding transcriptional MocR family regulator